LQKYQKKSIPAFNRFYSEWRIELRIEF
jgi:hypothetical protein